MSERPAKKVKKELGTDKVTIEVLEEAYRMARSRLHTCLSSLLFKFNDDDKRIFSDLKEQLADTYTRLRQSTSCVQDAAAADPY